MEQLNYKKILCPLDGSKKSNEALKYALKLGKIFNSNIILIFVVNEEYLKQIHIYQGEDLEEIHKRFIELGKTYFQKAKEEAKNESYNFSIEDHILRGNPAEEIIKFAKENADLVIMALRNTSYLAGNVIGHVTERVIKFCGIPVLVLP
jgi:nucleotide-binding universal stress UspA family protein